MVPNGHWFLTAKTLFLFIEQNLEEEISVPLGESEIGLHTMHMHVNIQTTQKCAVFKLSNDQKKIVGTNIFKYTVVRELLFKKERRIDLHIKVCSHAGKGEST